MSMYHYSSEEKRLCDICWDYKSREDVIMVDFGRERVKWCCKDCYREYRLNLVLGDGEDVLV